MNWLLLPLLVVGISGKVVDEPELPPWWNEAPETLKMDKSARMKLIVSMKEENLEKLTRTVVAVSTPGSPDYGKYLNFTEIQAMIAPSNDTQALVWEWLTSVDSAEVTGSGSTSLVVDATIEHIEQLFQTQIRYLVSETGVVTRASSYVIPRQVENLVNAVYGLHGLPLPLKPKKVSDTLMRKVTPDLLDEVYQIDSDGGSGSVKVRQAVAEFQRQYSSEKDQQAFFEKYIKDKYKEDYKLYKVVGSNEQNSQAEAALDVQYIMGVAPGVKTEFWGFQETDFCKAVKNFTDHIIAAADPPSVYSISYGWQGNLTRIGCKDELVDDIDKAFQQLAARGISIILASGDSGSGWTTQEGEKKLWPSWPASSPYVTAVGSTQFEFFSDKEEATKNFGSGGGFSFQFSQTSWQGDAVKGYITSQSGKLPPDQYWNSHGRATPDISALGDNYQVFIDGAIEGIGGTSASAPAFAGMISLINDALVAEGKPVLGFLNPFLYQNADAFTDIVTGDNKIGRGGEALQYGYDCVKGWDPVSGLGTPIFKKLKEAALNKK